MEKTSIIRDLYRDVLKNQPLKGYIFYEYVQKNLFHSVYKDITGVARVIDSFSRSHKGRSEEIFSYLGRYFNKTKNNLNLYLNIPFCRCKCRYCHYYTESILSSGHTFLDQYTTALVKEMGHFCERLEISDRVSFVALGGGTPLVLPQKSLQKIFQFLHKNKIVERSLISVETTPTEVCRQEGRDKLMMLKEMGVQRISLGVQSFSSNILRHMGARHTQESIFKAYEIVRECGFSHVNFDLLCCLSYEPEESQQEEAFSALGRLRPEAISLYRLNRHRNFLNRCFFPDKKNYQEERRMLKNIHTALSHLGYCKQGRHYIRDEEALILKERPVVEWLALEGDWLSFGANGRSTVDKIGFRNVKNVAVYCESIKKNINPIVIKTIFEPKAFMIRFIIYSIVCNHMIDKEAFYQRFHVTFDSVFSDPVRYLVQAGFLLDKGTKILIPEEHHISDLEIINGLCGSLSKSKK